MSRTETDRGTILRLRPFSEYDTIVTVFTEKYGKKTLLAKGLRRPKSRISGIIQPFSTISFECSVPRTENGFAKLTRVDLICPPPKKADPIFFFLSEVSEKLSREGHAVSAFSSLLQEIPSAERYEVLPATFLLKTLTIFGYLPEFGFCSRKGGSLEQGGKWLPSGEMVDSLSTEFGIPLFFPEIKTLRFWQKNPISVAEKVLVENESMQKYMRFLLDFLEKEQGIVMKTKEFVV